MGRRARGLSAALVAKAKPGRYGDGDGLYLFVRNAEAKFWTFRYTPRKGKMKEKGLGPVRLKSLSEARAEARELFRAHREGRDPLHEAAATRAALLVSSTTFKQEAEDYIKRRRAGWKNAKHAAQWSSTLETYAYPTIGDLSPAAIDTPLILKVLEPIWVEKPETANRVRNRIEAILDAAKARGVRTGDNPAAWKGNLEILLSGRVRRAKHHAALPYAEIGSFMEQLREQPGVAARLLEFTILTACRTGETLGATWDEIDLGGKLWTIPAERMKMHRVHRVPLSARSLAILREMGRDGQFVFPNARAGKPLSNMAMLVLLERMKRDDITVHGFRSSFRDWCAERTNYPSEVAEMALAHAVGDKVEAAYRRGDLFEKRRRLMDDWARFCATPATKTTTDKVVKLRSS